jgi:hypothetical protein
MQTGSFVSRLLLGMAFAMTLALGAVPHTSQADNSREYQLKAAYLLNFARFVYWPEESFETDESSFSICVYGENPFEGALSNLSSKQINNRPIRIRFLLQEEVDPQCQIAFFPKTSRTIYHAIKNQLPANVLTVGEYDGFCDDDGMIEFIQVNNKIRFIINLASSTENGIKYRSQLLEVAEQLR